jgi:hypothetical protein
MGREWGGGGQFTRNLGQGWMGSHHTRGGIPSKSEGLKERRELARGIGRGKPARGITRDCAIISIADLCMCIAMMYECN